MRRLTRALDNAALRRQLTIYQWAQKRIPIPVPDALRCATGIGPTMNFILQPWQLFLTILAGLVTPSRHAGWLAARKIHRPTGLICSPTQSQSHRNPGR